MSVLSIMAPLYLLVGLGALFHRYRFPSEHFWAHCEKLIYYALFPALIFSSLGRAQLDSAFAGALFWVITLPTLALGALQGLARWWPGVSPATFTAMFQGTVRSNTAVGLVLIAMLLPGDGVALMALVMTVMVIINNIACVMVLETWGDKSQAQATMPGKTSWHTNHPLLAGLAKNPLVLASLAGLGMHLLPFGIPDALFDAIAYLGKSGLPIALLTLGAGLRFHRLGRDIPAILISSVSKLVLLPLLVWGLCQQLGISDTATFVFVLYASLPTAMMSYVLASQMGGDKQAMARIITFQILVASITLPIILQGLHRLI